MDLSFSGKSRRVMKKLILYILGLSVSIAGGYWVASVGKQESLGDLVEQSEIQESDILRALQGGQEANEYSRRGAPALVGTVRANKLGVVRVLLDAGADVNRRDPDGNTALMVAVKLENTVAVEMLIRASAQVDIRGEEGKTPLMQAVQQGSVGMVNVLLGGGAQPDVKRSDGFTALMDAAKLGNLEIVDALIKGGATLHLKNALGETALLIALKHQKRDIIERLLRAGSIVDTRGEEGKLLLLLSARTGNNVRLETLLGAGVDVNATDENGKSAVELATEANQTEAVAILLEAGAVLNSRVKQKMKDHGEMAKLVEAHNCQEAFLKAISSGDIARVEKWIKYGVKPGKEAMEIACRQGRVPIVQILLDARYPVSQQAIKMAFDRKQEKVLRVLACSGELIKGKLAKWIEIYGNETDKKLWIHVQTTASPLLMAVRQGNLENVEFELLSGEPVNQLALEEAVEGNHPEILTRLLDQMGTEKTYAMRRLVAIYGCETLATMSVRTDNVKQLKLLMEMGDVADEDLLAEVVDGRREEILNYWLTSNTETRDRVLNWIKDNRGDITTQWLKSVRDLRAPLTIASAEGRVDEVERLLEKHQPVPQRALEVAIEGGHVEVLEVLLDHLGLGQGVALRQLQRRFGSEKLVGLAIENEDRKLLMLLASMGILIDEQTLAMAAESGAWQMVRELELMGVGVNQQAVLAAIAKGNVGVIQDWIERGVAMGISIKDATRAVVIGGHVEAVRLLVKYRMVDGDFGLVLAAERGNEEIIKVLKEAGFQLSNELVSAAVRGGQMGMFRKLTEAGYKIPTNSVEWASRLGHVDLLRILLETGGQVSQQTVEWAVSNRRQDVLQLLLQYGGSVSERALMEAVKSGQTEVSALLMTYWRNTKEQRPTLSKVSSQKKSNLIRVAAEGNATKTQALLEAGANVHEKDAYGYTALSAAAASGSTETVGILLARGAKADYVALLNAVEGDHVAIVNLLLNTPLRQDPMALRAAIMAAADKGNVDLVDTLLKAGAPVQTSAMAAASRAGRYRVVQQLINAGAKAESGYAERGLWAAAEAGHADIVALWVKAGVKIDSQDSQGETALMKAVKCKHEKVVQILLKFGADVMICDRSGHTALKWAEESKRQTIIKMLRHAEEVLFLPPNYIEKNSNAATNVPQ